MVKVQTRTQLETSEEPDWQRRPFPHFKFAHVTDWVANRLGSDVSGDTGGGVAPYSVFLYPPTYHLNGIHLLQGSGVLRESKRESWSRWITGNEWKTLAWPDQGRKTHVLLVLVVWLPVERVGNFSSRRDGEMEGWKRWRRRRWPLHVCDALSLTWKRLLAYCSFVRGLWYFVGKGWII